MATIPIQLNDTDLEKIDYLIQIGKYKNRSQAIKSMIQSKLEQDVLPKEWDSEKDREIRKKLISQMLQLKDIQIDITSKKSAVELVREQRDR